MSITHEGEIIFKEIYGTHNTKRLYVKPPDQSNIVVLDEEQSSEIANFFTRIFLPQGYPTSVSRDYTNYQIWDTAQAFCSTITGILATQEVLRGVGVGDKTATPLAATVTWVLKDGCGHLGKIYFAYRRGTHLDAYSKMWRLYADALNDAAMCIEIALPAFQNFTTYILCISTVMKAIVGVAGGATRAAMTQHHAIRNNLADVSAKDSAQETAVNLVASLVALIIITVFGSSLIIFAVMVVFHIVFNYMAVRSVCLRTFNAPRFLQVVEIYLREEVIARPCLINRIEPIIAMQMGRLYMDKKLCGFHIIIGESMSKLVNRNPKAEYMKNLKELYNYTDYILLPCMETREISVFLRESAESENILCAYFHSILLGIIICAINRHYLPIYKNPEIVSKPFPIICDYLENAEWTKETMEIPCEPFKFEPSIELIEFVNRVVQKEWITIKSGLAKIGWDLAKNLLLIDEWRICNPKFTPKQTFARGVDSHKRYAYDLLNFSQNHNNVEENCIENCTIEPDIPSQSDSNRDKVTTSQTSTTTNSSVTNAEEASSTNNKADSAPQNSHTQARPSPAGSLSRFAEALKASCLNAADTCMSGKKAPDVKD